MKIGFDAKRLFHNNTGLGNYSRDLVRILKTYYPNNDYILYNPKPKDLPFFSDKNNFNIISPSGLMRKLHFIWRTYGIAKTATAKQLDIYHGLSGEIAVGLPSNVKKVVTIHDLIFERYPYLYSKWDRKAHFKKFKYAVDNADAIVAISEQTKQDIVTYLKVAPEKIEVIYQGCAQAFKEHYTTNELQTTREKFNLPEQFVLNVGTIEERKNALSLVKAIKDLNTKLVLIGRKTDYAKSIDQYIAEHKIEHKVIFLHGVSLTELAHIYQLATVFAYPSIFEGFGIPIIEALYSGTPVITTNSGVFPEAGGPDSIYVNEYDVEQISDAISTLLKDETTRLQIAERGRVYAQKFNDEQIAKHWNNLYTKILE
ncbi:glycosyltransferase family 4 protein [Myroides marinus]|uniref:glycosyltransferase family 4 protein n=1 Tax=Myroides marinus TaxID=703342 RepID=UPI0025765C95|nr:glycosyltransferase family 1 protein [Myroides marinus]MDM1369493.1 glycosyltransferase family 4 protein [Myroides marinus]MDM1383806.1 glycosyltransferase family 4 protein [Myroides marinus]MDM1533599.1 glycosyltransferase family 4 protein [Myroides marinus]MDM1540562.1 glycosyltransferase family 4 protein [Myroides marinus]